MTDSFNWGMKIETITTSPAESSTSLFKIVLNIYWYWQSFNCLYTLWLLLKPWKGSNTTLNLSYVWSFWKCKVYIIIQMNTYTRCVEKIREKN